MSNKECTQLICIVLDGHKNIPSIKNNFHLKVYDALGLLNYHLIEISSS